MRPDRHAFVRLAAPPAGADPEVAAWQAAGLPFVVASAWAGDPPERLRLGLATPDRGRIGFAVACEDVAAVLPPPSLAEAVRHAPPAWAPTLAAVAATCAEAGVAAAVFGSLAWQCRSGRRFLRPDSDLDLLLAAPALRRDVVAVLLRADVGRPRLDGEWLFPGGEAVALRELAGAPAAVLTKRHGGPRLVPAAGLAP